MPFSSLVSLGMESPLRIEVIRACDASSITYAGLLQPLRLAEAALGTQRLAVQVQALEAIPQSALPSAHLILLVADNEPLQLTAQQSKQLLDHCRTAKVWGAVGAAVLWLARSGEMKGLRTALPRALDVEVGDVAEAALLTSHLFELDGNRLTCCGGAAGIDFSLTLIETLFGPALQADIMEILCVQHVRSATDRQHHATQVRFASLQPKLSEALQLMEANIEEPLATDDIARLVGISRRQLERQFKQYLGNMPSRYYLELRLQRAKQLLLDSHHSIVQVGLMCGFSSGSHFATAYGTLFGITPREERQRKLSTIAHEGHK
jgi:transcriptional regulator GlxA family with amidase domain